jgi:hypothetical protein
MAYGPHHSNRSRGPGGAIAQAIIFEPMTHVATVLRPGELRALGPAAHVNDLWATPERWPGVVQNEHPSGPENVPTPWVDWEHLMFTVGAMGGTLAGAAIAFFGVEAVIVSELGPVSLGGASFITRLKLIFLIGGDALERVVWNAMIGGAIGGIAGAIADKERQSGLKPGQAPSGQGSGSAGNSIDAGRGSSQGAGTGGRTSGGTSGGGSSGGSQPSTGSFPGSSGGGDTRPDGMHSGSGQGGRPSGDAPSGTVPSGSPVTPSPGSGGTTPAPAPGDTGLTGEPVPLDDQGRPITQIFIFHNAPEKSYVVPGTTGGTTQDGGSGTGSDKPAEGPPEEPDDAEPVDDNTEERPNPDDPEGGGRPADDGSSGVTHGPGIPRWYERPDPESSGSPHGPGGPTLTQSMTDFARKLFGPGGPKLYERPAPDDSGGGGPAGRLAYHIGGLRGPSEQLVRKQIITIESGRHYALLGLPRLSGESSGQRPTVQDPGILGLDPWYAGALRRLAALRR